MNKHMKYLVAAIVTLASAAVVIPVFIASLLALLPICLGLSVFNIFAFEDVYGGVFGLFIKYCKWVEDKCLCKFPYFQRRRERKEAKRRKLAARELRRQSAVEHEVARQRAIDDLASCIPLMRLEYDKIIVDTNVFMNAVQGTDTDAKTYAVSTKFFSAIRKLGLKVHIIASQLNELSNMKREGDEKKKYKVRGAQKEIENLQNEGLLAFLGDTRARESYADPEIIKIARKLAKDGVRPLVITDDRDLRIRLGAEGITRKSLIELYEGLVETFDWKCDDQWLGDAQK